ncbi:MAG: hypothetical protein NTY35_07515 [Planctomycetota bacterium]|nr:hypothetical protein [Planctomycetota bacterium]
MRTSLIAALALTSHLPLAEAQAPATARPATAVRDAGTLHLATGTWTRRAQQATLGPDVLYENTCPSGYYSALSGFTYVDEGRIPSPSAPPPVGCSTYYRVDGFTFSYCTDQTPSSFGTYTHRFYADHPACSPVLGITPTATIALNGLPSSAAGALTCWTVTIDLTGAGGGSFVLTADGDGQYTGGTTADRFAWGMTSTAPGTQTGPVIAGNPAVCAEGAGTYFTGNPGPGTGLGNRDSFRITDLSGGPAYGCAFFGGNPFAGFELRLYGTACEPFLPQTAFCAGDGGPTHTQCPCGNNSSVGDAVGCLNSLGKGGKLRVFGNASLANDTVVLLGSDMTNAACLYFQGTLRHNGGAGTVFGDGLRCAGGAVSRLGTKLNGAGASQYPSPGDASISVMGAVTMPGTRTYQGWYRNNAAFCTPAGFNLTNGIEFAWGT